MALSDDLTVALSDDLKGRASRALNTPSGTLKVKALDVLRLVTERDGLVAILQSLGAGLSHGERNWWLVVDDCQPLTDDQADLFQRLIEDQP